LSQELSRLRNYLKKLLPLPIVQKTLSFHQRYCRKKESELATAEADDKWHGTKRSANDEKRGEENFYLCCGEQAA
jgi:hypothetical protein